MSQYHSSAINLYTAQDLSVKGLSVDVTDACTTFSAPNAAPLKFDSVVSLLSSHGNVTDVAQKIAEIVTSVTAEATSRAASNVTLQTNIDTEKTRIDQILNGSTADLANFSAIIAAYEAVDTSTLAQIATLQASLNDVIARLDALTDSS